MPLQNLHHYLVQVVPGQRQECRIDLSVTRQIKLLQNLHRATGRRVTGQMITNGLHAAQPPARRPGLCMSWQTVTLSTDAVGSASTGVLVAGHVSCFQMSPYLVLLWTSLTGNDEMTDLALDRLWCGVVSLWLTEHPPYCARKGQWAVLLGPHTDTLCHTVCEACGLTFSFSGQRPCLPCTNRQRWPPAAQPLSNAMASNEHVWDMIGRCLHQRQGPPTTLTEHDQTLQEEYNRLPQTAIGRIIRITPRRLNECLTNHGCITSTFKFHFRLQWSFKIFGGHETYCNTELLVVIFAQLIDYYEITIPHR